MNLAASSTPKKLLYKQGASTTLHVDMSESFVDTENMGENDPYMESLHASYGSLNNSYGNFNASLSSLANYHDADGGEDAFFSPKQHESPWGVTLRKTVPNTLAASPTPRLQKVDSGRRQRGDWIDPSESSLLQDLNANSPKASPWRKRQSTNPSLATVSKPSLALPVYSSPAKKSERHVAFDTTVKVMPESSSKKKTKKVVGAVQSLCTTKPMKSPNRKKRFTPPSYGAGHQKAASIIAALLRGRRDRMKAKVLRLERRLEMIKVGTATDLLTITERTKQNKKDLKKRAKERYMKNISRKSQQDPQLEGNQETISRLRKENAKVREQNVQIAQDIAALRINNDRLNSSHAATEACLSQLRYHDDTCEGENARLLSIKAKYEKVINDHEEHLDMHDSHIEVEVKIKGLYRDLLGSILEKLDKSKYAALRKQVYEMAGELDEFNHLDGNAEKL